MQFKQSFGYQGSRNERRSKRNGRAIYRRTEIPGVPGVIQKLQIYVGFNAQEFWQEYGFMTFNVGTTKNINVRFNLLGF